MMTSLPTQEIDRETLVAELRQLGVTYLAPSDAVASTMLPSNDALLAAILDQSDFRLKLALIPLLIRHPDWAQTVQSLVDRLDASLALELQTLYTAAVYLQRLWKTRLGFYLTQPTLLPDLYSQTLGLPSPNERFGKTGLYELTDAWKSRSRYPFDRMASLSTVMDLFFAQLKLEYPLSPHATAR